MSRSLTETRALAYRAALGAGAPAGLAEVFAALAVAHLRAGRPEKPLAAALRALPRGPVLQLAVMQAEAEASLGKPVAMPAGIETDLLMSFAQSRPIRCDIDQAAQTVTLRPDVPAAQVVGRISGCDGFFDLMSRFAAKTLVPETDISREKGAGAGEIDND